MARSLIVGGLLIACVTAALLPRDKEPAHTKASVGRGSYPGTETRTRQTPEPAEPSAFQARQRKAAARVNSNPLIAVTESGFHSAPEEREALLLALKTSGATAEPWATRAQKRIEDVEAFVSAKELGSASALGCWAAGCAAQVEFDTPESAGFIETLADPEHEGAWEGGVIITEPRPDESGTEQSSALIFFVSPTR